MRADALRDLVLVVGKHQVGAAAVDVETLAQQCPRHRRALDVPAGPPPAPRAFPAGLRGVRRFPQDKIHRIALVGRHLDAGAGDHVVGGAARQAAIVGERRHLEQHMAVRRIGFALRDQPLDHRDHLADVFGRARLVGGRQAAQRRHVVLKPARRLLRHRVDGHAALLRPRDDLVVDVGDVAHIGHVIGAVGVAQQPEQHVEHHRRPRVADVGAVIDRGAADIHPHVVGIERRERPLAPRHAVVKLYRHGSRSRFSPAAGLDISGSGTA